MRRFIFILILSAVTVSKAQNLTNKLAVDLNINFREFKGDLGSQFNSFNDGSAQPGLGFTYYLNKFLNIRAYGNYGASNYFSNYRDSGANPRLNVAAFNTGLQVLAKLNNGFILKENFRIAPYIGLGIAYWNQKTINTTNSVKTSAFAFPTTLGINFVVHPRVNIIAQTTHNFVFSDKIDAVKKPINGATDKWRQYTIGVSFNFGNKNASKNIADADKDGVADAIDRCPNTRIGAKVDEFGCEIVSLTANAEIKGIVKNILFELNSDVLQANSFVELQKVVAILNKYPESILMIEGHTDNIGKTDYNLDLSNRRALSVRKFLIDQGISEDRLLAKGFGQTLPIAENETEAGRQKNRRVELILTK